MQEEFEACELPSKEQREALAAELDIPTRSVQIWFQNRRQRVKVATGRPKLGTERHAASGNDEEESQEEMRVDTLKEKRRSKAEKNRCATRH